MNEWIATNARMPEAGQIVLAHYMNAHGKNRIIRATWIAENSEESIDDMDELGVYCEADDTYYWPEGWYEQIDNWSDYCAVVVNEGEITHWMPLPAPPWPT